MYAFSVSANDLLEKLLVPLYRARHVLRDLEQSGTVAVVELGSEVDVSSGSYVAGYHPTGLAYLRVDNVRHYVADLNSADLVYVEEHASGVTARTIVAERDVVIARTGTLGKATLAAPPLPGSVMSQHVTRLTVKDATSLAPEYLAAFLNCDLGRFQLIYGGYGSTRQELTHAVLKKVRLPKIEAGVQKEIESLVSEGVTGAHESLAELQTIVREFEELLGLSRLDLPSEECFATDPQAINNMWTPRFHKPAYVELQAWLRAQYSCLTVRELADVVRGKGTKVSEYALSGVPFVRTSSLINFGIDPFPDHYANEDVESLFEQPVQTGDILFSMEGKIGEVAYLDKDDDCVFKNHIERIRCHDESESMYVFLCLASRIGRYQADKNMVVQATIPGMANRVRDILLPMKPEEDSAREAFSARSFVLTDRARRAIDKRSRAVAKLRQAQRQLEDVLESLAH